jgi:hypothetical protein
MQTEFTKWAHAKGENALLGTWAKIGRSAYQRMTGEIVKKVGNAWAVDGATAYQTRAAAFSAVDWTHN